MYECKQADAVLTAKAASLLPTFTHVKYFTMGRKMPPKSLLLLGESGPPVGAPSTYTKWHLDWFSRFSTAHGLTDRQTTQVCLQCFDAVGWATGRASGLWWGARVVVCLERGADLHMAQLIPLPLTVSCFSEIHIGFTSLVPAHPGSPGKDR